VGATTDTNGNASSSAAEARGLGPFTAQRRGSKVPSVNAKSAAALRLQPGATMGSRGC
jgi:hypothetical protein